MRKKVEGTAARTRGCTKGCWPATPQRAHTRVPRVLRRHAAARTCSQGPAQRSSSSPLCPCRVARPTGRAPREVFQVSGPPGVRPRAACMQRLPRQVRSCLHERGRPPFNLAAAHRSTGPGTAFPALHCSGWRTCAAPGGAGAHQAAWPLASLSRIFIGLPPARHALARNLGRVAKPNGPLSVVRAAHARQASVCRRCTG